MESPDVRPWSDLEPVTPDWLNEAERGRYPASMEFWFPRLLEVDGVKVPDTEWVKLESAVVHEDTIHEMYSAEYDFDELVAAVEEVDGPPAFLRTDMASNGLDYGGACIDSLEEDRVRNIAGDVLHFNISLAEVPFSSLVVREWLDIVSFGTEFGVEVRVFVSEGEVNRWGFYWPEDDVECSKEVYEKTKEIADDRGNEVLDMADRVASRFDIVDVVDGWSVDFILTEEDDWYCTDMAPASMSMKPDDLFEV